MTDEQYKELLNAVIDSKESSNKVSRELTSVRGEMAKLTGAVHDLRGEVIMLGATVELTQEDVGKINAQLGAMMQTLDGMNHLAKSAYDMASDGVKKLKSLSPDALEDVTDSDDKRTKVAAR